MWAPTSNKWNYNYNPYQRPSTLYMGKWGYIYILHTYIYIYKNTPLSGAITPYQRPCTLYMGNWGVITPIITTPYKWFLGPPSAWTPAG